MRDLINQNSIKLKESRIQMKALLAILVSIGLMNLANASNVPFYSENERIEEVVFVESPTDTDHDGEFDKIYIKILRPNVSRKLSTLYMLTPYGLLSHPHEIEMHNVDIPMLPQDGSLTTKRLTNFDEILIRSFKSFHKNESIQGAYEDFAFVYGHSVGTGYSKGCPTVGDVSEAIAGKSVIDWLNGRARGFYEDGREAKADWANGSVGMYGTSYDGTLAMMVATTGVEGLEAIYVDGGISNWYDYYRANGLVINPYGYYGEDIDVLNSYITRNDGKCKHEIAIFEKNMGREHGDYTPFWEARNYLAKIKDIKAATYISHGQSDWNVKQKHAIQLWDNLSANTKKHMHLHNGNHNGGETFNQDWFYHFLEGKQNGAASESRIKVILNNDEVMVQNQWPLEGTRKQRFYFSENNSLTTEAPEEKQLSITDNGGAEFISKMTSNSTNEKNARLVFLSDPSEENILISGTTNVSLNVAVLNRQAANITVNIFEYFAEGKTYFITRGWADPQNYESIKKGEKLVPGQNYKLAFKLEPKQYMLSQGSRIGIMLASSDKEFTMRPKAGTVVQFTLGENSFIDISLIKKKLKN
jgi:X-Pro dipeptidyl-peptidase